MNSQKEAKLWLKKLGYLLYVGSLTWIIFQLFSEWTYDDPYITYRYAYNLKYGLGFVYNPGEYILSTTSPFYSLLLALLSFIFTDIPRLAIFLGALSISLGAIVLFDLATNWNSTIVGWAGLLLFPTSPLLLSTLGSEIPLFLFLCLGALAFYGRGIFSLSIFFLALASLTRPDGLLLAAILLIDYMIRFSKPIPWRALSLFAFLISPWIIFSWIYFGSPIPATLAVKHNQAKMAISPSFLTRLPAIFRLYYSPWQGTITAALVLIGIPYLIKKNRHWTPFLIWPVLHLLAYSLLGVSGYFWYYSLLIPGIIALTCLGLQTIWSFSQNTRKKSIHKNQLPIIITLILIGFLIVENIQTTANILENPDQRGEIYQIIGEWLNLSVPKNARIATLESGIIGFYAHRSMIDFAGLLYPQVSNQFSKDSTYEDAAVWVFQYYQPDYIVLKKGMFPKLENVYITRNCHKTKQFLGNDYNYTGTIVIFKCIYN